MAITLRCSIVLEHGSSFPKGLPDIPDQRIPLVMLLWSCSRRSIVRSLQTSRQSKLFIIHHEFWKWGFVVGSILLWAMQNKISSSHNLYIANYVISLPVIEKSSNRHRTVGWLQRLEQTYEQFVTLKSTSMVEPTTAASGIATTDTLISPEPGACIREQTTSINIHCWKLSGKIAENLRHTKLSCKIL